MSKIKKIRRMICVLVSALCVECFPVAASPAKVQDAIFSAKEQLALMNYDDSLISNSNMIAIKKAGYISQFLQELKDSYVKEKKRYDEEHKDQLEEWGISTKETISQLEQSVNASDTHSLNAKSISNFSADSGDTVQKAKNNSEDGKMYVYMCINNLKQTDVTSKLRSLLTNKKTTIAQVMEEDFRREFRDTYIPAIMYKYLNMSTKSAKSNLWPKLNPTNIQSYARKYAKSPKKMYKQEKSDCTNFASQALYYGGLKKNYYNSDVTRNGYVNTYNRWFYFNNQSNSKRSVSTSWVRVQGLYSYLAPHYRTYSTSNKNNMNSNLKTGYILQGKHFFGDYSHTVIITKTNGKYTYCGHSNPRKDEKMDTFYSSYWTYRVIKTY